MICGHYVEGEELPGFTRTTTTTTQEPDGNLGNTRGVTPGSGNAGAYDI